MKNHLLTHIEIKNFKCFDSFKAEGFKRVNLISGKNNVGKTALMEACYVNVYAESVESFVYALGNIQIFRQFINLYEKIKINFEDSFVLRKQLTETTSKISTDSNINIASYRIEKANGNKIYVFHLNKNEKKIDVSDFNFEIVKSISNIHFVASFSSSYTRIIKNYASIQKKDQENLLNLMIQELDPNIESFKIIDDTPQCKIKGHYVELAEFGDGLRNLVSIITALFKTENGYLFIDEIGSGIHYTQLERLWEIVLTLAEKNNVQVFATTHSKECIEAYARTAQKLNRQDIAFIRLSQLQNGEIKASVFDYDLLQNSMEQDHEVRGW